MTAIPHPLHSEAAHADHAHAHEHHEIGFVKKYIFSIDHKMIGLQFLFLGLFFFVVGGLEAMLVRWQLGWPGRAVPVLMVTTNAANADVSEALEAGVNNFVVTPFTADTLKEKIMAAAVPPAA